MSKLIEDRDVLNLFALEDTIKCVKQNCINCSYKIILHPGSYGEQCALN